MSMFNPSTETMTDEELYEFIMEILEDGAYQDSTLKHQARTLVGLFKDLYECNKTVTEEESDE